MDHNHDAFWNAIGYCIDAEAYNNEPRISGLLCRRIFASEILAIEMIAHDPWVRDVPVLEYIRHEWCESERDTFIERFGEVLANHDDHDPEDIYLPLNFLRPLTDKFYCFHCRSVVTAMVNEPPDNNECWCEVCHGWVLLEMDPENLDEVPNDPIDMEAVKRRLVPALLSPSPLVQALDDTFINITISEEDDPVDDVCPTCVQAFEDGQSAVALMCNCNLFYHSDCFDELINSWESRCPSCRQIILTDDELYNIYLRTTAN